MHLLVIRNIVFVVVALYEAASEVRGTGVQNCTEAQRRCASQLGCNMALQNYWVHCTALVHGETYECSSKCQMALAALLSIEDNVGDMFMKCNCQDNARCIEQKSRIEVCNVPVRSLMQKLADASTPVSCSLATMICVADSPCMTALEFYHSHCRGLLRGERCTPRCNNSLSILYRQKQARNLLDCACDGREDYNCQQVRQSTQRLCIEGRHGVRHPHRHHHHNTTHSSRESSQTVQSYAPIPAYYYEEDYKQYDDVIESGVNKHDINILVISFMSFSTLSMLYFHVT